MGKKIVSFILAACMLICTASPSLASEAVTDNTESVNGAVAEDGSGGFWQRAAETLQSLIRPLASTGEPFAVYCGDDGSLTFYCGTAPDEGETYDGKAVTNVYTGFETETWDDSPDNRQAWYANRTSITAVSFDESFATVQPVSMARWFEYFTNCTNINLTNLDSSKVTTMESTFYNMKSLNSLDVSGLDTSSVTNMSCMFYNCSGLSELNVSKFNTSNVTNMSYMFCNCSGLTTIGLSNFVTDKVESMEGMFCSWRSDDEMSWTELNLSSFNTENVTNMWCMFWKCSDLRYLDISSFNTSKVDAASSASNFAIGCTSLEWIKIGDNFDLFERSSGALVSQQNWYDSNENGNLISSNYMIGVSGSGTYWTYTNESVDPVLEISKSVDKEACSVGNEVTYTITVKQTQEGAVSEAVEVIDSLPDGLAVSGGPAVSASGGTALIYGTQADDGHAVYVNVGEEFSIYPNGEDAASIYSQADTVPDDFATSSEAYNGLTFITASYFGGAWGRIVDGEVVESGEFLDGVNYVTYTASRPGIYYATFNTVSGGILTYTVYAGLEEGELAAYIPELGYGETADITVTLRVGEGLAGRTVTNTATATDGSGNSVSGSASFTVADPEPGLSVSVTADKSMYDVGDQAVYTITVEQTEQGATATGVTVTDSCDGYYGDYGLVFGAVKTTKGDVRDKSECGFAVDIGSLEYGETVTITAEAAIGERLAGQTFTNTATATYNEGGPEEASVSASSPALYATLDVSLASDKDIYNPGDTITYTLTATQATPHAYSGGAGGWWTYPEKGLKTADESEEKVLVEWADLSSGTQGTGYAPSGVGYGESYTQTLSDTVTRTAAGECITMTAEAYDNDSGLGGKAFRTVYVRKPGISVSLAADREQYNVGDVVTYTMTVSETEDDVPSEEVEATLSLPGGLTPVEGSWAVSGGSNTSLTDNGAEATVCIPLLEKGSDVTVTVQAVVGSSAMGGKFTASAEATDVYGNYGSASLTAEALEPGLSIDVKADGTAYSLTDIVTYTITLAQTSEGAIAQGTVVADSLPEELGIISVKSSLGEPVVEGNGFSLFIGDLAFNEPVTITVAAEALAEGEGIVNAARATADYIGQAEGSYQVSVRTPFISISNTADAGTYYPGDVITYSITVSNDTEANAYNVAVEDALPEGLALLSAEAGGIPSDGAEEQAADTEIQPEAYQPESLWEVSSEGGTATASVDVLAPGEEAVITVQAVADDSLANTDVENTASVSADAIEAVSDYSLVRIVKPVITVEEEPASDVYSIGDEVSFTVTVKQVTEGLTAENVSVAYEVPGGVEVTGVTVSGVEGSAGNGVAAIPSLAYGETAVITITGTAVSAGSFPASASVSADHADGAAAETGITVLEPVLSVTKTASASECFVGDEVEYTVTASQGTEGAYAYGVTLEDVLPEGMEVLEAIPGGSSGSVSYDSGSVTVECGSLGYGEEATVLIKARASGSAANTATGNTATASARNAATAVSDPAGVMVMAPSLAITKTSDESECSPGGTVTYTITVSQTEEGAYEEDVIISDILPEGMSLTGEPALTGAEGEVASGEGSLTASIPVLAYGEEASLVFTASPDGSLAGETVVNTAYASGSHSSAEPASDEGVKVPEAPVGEAAEPSAQAAPAETSDGRSPIALACLAAAAAAAMGGRKAGTARKRKA